MKINSQELLLIKKGMRFEESNSVSSPMNSQSNSATSNPESVLNAMHLQSQNNIAFQGANSSVLSKMRGKVAPKLLMALFALGVAATVPSCRPIDINQTVTIDLSALTSYFTEMNDYLKQILEQQQLTNDLIQQTLDNQNTQNALLEKIYDNGVATLEEVKLLNNNYSQGQLEIIKVLTAQGATQQEILEAINKFGTEHTNILNQLLNGTITLDDALVQIEALLKEILNTVIEISDTLKNLSEATIKYYELQDQRWYGTLRELEKINQQLDMINTNGQITNLKLDDLKAEAQISNDYLALLNEKVDSFKEELANIGNNGMTVEEFIEALAERDAIRAEEFAQFIKDYGFDQIPANQEKIIELIERIEAKVAEKGEYAEQLDRIIAFLENLDFSNPEHLAKLDEIINLIENFKCGCEHGNNPDDTDESVTDLEDMFGG